MAQPFNLNIIQGSDYGLNLTVTVSGGSEPMDLTGASARLQARPTVTSQATYIDLTDENGITILEPPTSGLMQINLSAAETSAINVDSGVYDLELITAAGQVTRLLEGRVILDREVTR